MAERIIRVEGVKNPKIDLKGQGRKHLKTMKPAMVVSFVLLVFSFLFLWEQWSGDMKKVYIVQTGNSENPVYPPICAVCLSPGNTPLVSLSLDPEDARADYLFYRPKKNGSFSNQPFHGIMAHHKCIRKVQYTLLTHLFLILLIGAAIAAIGVLNGFSLFFCLIAAVILATPLFYFEFTTPLPVEYFFHEEKKIFSFTNKQYAETFARLNDAGLQEGDYNANFPRSYKK